MSLDYSSGADAHYSSTRRIVLISAFLTLSVAAFSVFHVSNDKAYETTAVAVAEVESKQPTAAEVAVHVDHYDDIVQGAVNDALRVPEASDWTKVSVKSGESLSNIFDSLSIPADDWIALTKLGGDSAQLKKLKAGDQLNIKLASGRLQELSYALDETRTLNIRRGDRGFETTTLTSSLDRRSSEAAGMIRNSLFADAHRAGLSDRLILEFADIFGYDIDFAQDLQDGDHFSVVYEQLYNKGGKKVREGDILAAEFVNQGHRYRAVRYVDPDGHAIYYTPEGQSLRKAFIRTPVDFARISSPFNLHRMHPILNIIRAHKGVDYAAATGTPVHATGDGKVEFIGKKSGYGNVLMIRHGAQYETVYGHLSRFASGLHEGTKIRQGQTVAFVGMTGLATAPHLHYEFRVNGIHQNPVTVPLPRANPLSSQVLAQFRNHAEPLVARLDAISSSQFARLDTGNARR
jgi:murein DD-endopeptidase MepM/ murein hydrolase activator NlpD